MNRLSIILPCLVPSSSALGYPWLKSKISASNPAVDSQEPSDPPQGQKALLRGPPTEISHVPQILPRKQKTINARMLTQSPYCSSSWTLEESTLCYITQDLVGLTNFRVKGRNDKISPLSRAITVTDSQVRGNQ